MIDFQFINVEEIKLSYVADWYKKIAKNEAKELGDIALVFGTDDWLLELNKKHLNHDFYTDVITFDYCEDNVLSGDLLISLERVHDNAKTFKIPPQTELNRVIVHGFLHLCGFNDHTEEEIKTMRTKEDFYLALL